MTKCIIPLQSFSPACPLQLMFFILLLPPLPSHQVHYKYIEAAAKTGQLKEVCAGPCCNRMPVMWQLLVLDFAERFVGKQDAYLL